MRHILGGAGGAVALLELPRADRVLMHRFGEPITLRKIDGTLLWSGVAYRLLAVCARRFAYVDHANEELHVVDLETGVQQTLPTMTMVRALAFSPRGELAWTAFAEPFDAGAFYLWDGTRTIELDAMQTWAIGFVAERDVLVAGPNGMYRVRGEPLDEGPKFETKFVAEHLAATAAGMLAISDLGSVALIDPDNGAIRWQLEARCKLRVICSHDNRHVARLPGYEHPDIPRHVEWAHVGGTSEVMPPPGADWIDAAWLDGDLLVHTAYDIYRNDKIIAHSDEPLTKIAVDPDGSIVCGTLSGALVGL